MSEVKIFEDHFIKPNFRPISDSAGHYRRLMVLYSSIALFLVFGSSGIDYEGSSFLGIKFEGVNTTFVFTALFISILYFCVCFILEGWHGYMECKLRLTGLSARSKSVDDVNSSADIERHSTLYSYFRRYVVQSQDAYKHIVDKHGLLSSEELIQKHKKIIEFHEYISEALNRFEDGFVKAQRFKLWSWVGYEFFIPVLIASVAAGSLFFIKLFPLICAPAAM